MKDLYFQDTEALYRQYKEIPGQAFREKISYVDSRREFIDQLAFDYWIDVQLSYTFALFEIGAYDRFLEKADLMIEKVILHNLYYYEHQDVYCELLFRKAASLYNIGDLDKAIKIIDQIIAIDHTHKFAPAFLQKCISLKRRYDRSRIQALGIILLFLGVGFIALELLVFKPFIPQLTATANSVRMGLLIPGIALIIWAELYNHLIARYLVAKKVKNSIKKHKKKD